MTASLLDPRSLASIATTPSLPMQRTRSALGLRPCEMKFYGLPIEILQHMATFLPFHSLVKVYRSLPRSYQPIFQQQLDRLLALMMLTLELQQHPRESIDSTSPPLASAGVLQTQWRATSFDMESMSVEFQLEDKLGVEMAERRQHEFMQQQFMISSTTSSHSFGHRSPQMSSARSQHLLRAEHASREDIESIIWKSRTRAVASNSQAEPDIATDAPDRSLLDSNFFHCDHLNTPTILQSATVSFKAHRNVPAPWIAQSVEPLCFHISSSPAVAHPEVSLRAAAESPGSQRAAEKAAAAHQNWMLQRALAKFANQGMSGSVQFLPTDVELDASELGQKRAKAVFIKPRRLCRQKGEQQQRLGLFGRIVATIGNSCADLLRDRSGPVSFASVSSRLHSYGPSKRLMQFLKRSLRNAVSMPWMPFIAADLRCCDGTRHSTGGEHAANWTSLISTIAACAFKLCRGCSCVGNYVVVTTTCVLSAGKGKERHPEGYNSDNAVRRATGQEKRRDENEKEDRVLFEFTYDVRHNYLLSARLEGERVIRPIRFACSLDFFCAERVGDASFIGCRE